MRYFTTLYKKKQSFFGDFFVLYEKIHTFAKQNERVLWPSG